MPSRPRRHTKLKKVVSYRDVTGWSLSAAETGSTTWTDTLNKSLEQTFDTELTVRWLINVFTFDFIMQRKLLVRSRKNRKVPIQYIIEGNGLLRVGVVLWLIFLERIRFKPIWSSLITQPGRSRGWNYFESNWFNPIQSDPTRPKSIRCCFRHDKYWANTNESDF